MFCQSCGAQLAGAFCTNCGVAAGRPSQPSAVPPASAPSPAVRAGESQELANEHLHHLGDAAQEHGKEAAKLAQRGIGAVVERMGKVAFGAAAVLWVAWFFLPAATLSGRAVAAHSYTFWGLIGTNFTDLLLMQNPTSHGLFSILGLIASAAPFAAAFLQIAWARYLNAAPLAYVLVAWIAIYVNQHHAFGVIAIEEGANPFSLSWGIFVLTGAAIVLAAGALRKPKA